MAFVIEKAHYLAAFVDHYLSDFLQNRFVIVKQGYRAFNMIRIKTIPAAALLAVITVWLPANNVHAIALGNAEELVPHRAVYEMTLDASRPAKGISGVQGRMVFEFAGSGCDGYTMNMRLVTRVEAYSGRASVSDLRSSTWEHGAGKQYRFNSSHYQGEKLKDSTSGDAVRLGNDGHVVVHVRVPKAKDLKVDGPVLFPTQHSLEILHAARSGKHLLQARVYDGSSNGDKVYATTAFIGKTLQPGAKLPAKRIANDETLEKLESWPISISYFDTDEETKETPVYQLNFRLYTNGVSRELLIDYGDFAIKGVLSSLEFMPSSECK